jgi:hypothetical protein
VPILGVKAFLASDAMYLRRASVYGFVLMASP